MATRKKAIPADEGEAEVPVTVKLVNELVVAEGTEYERTIQLRLPRGKFARGITSKIIESIAGFGALWEAEESDSVDLVAVGTAMTNLFNYPDFMETLVPITLGLFDPKTGSIDKEDVEWLDMLTDMELFEAYGSAAGFVASGGDMSEEAEAASKKSKAGKDAARK